jgi:hypothetical protein
MKPVPKLLIPVLLAGAALAQNFNIRPFITCVNVDPATSAVTAYWGYESFEPNIVQILVGQDNQFVPPPASQGQPVLFFPGYHEKAFRTTVQGIAVEWSMLGNAVFASGGSPRCAPTTVQPPLPLSLPPATVFVPYSQQLAAIGAQSGVTWSAVGTPPAGLALAANGVLSGAPQAAGQAQITVQATDGITASQRTYGLLIGSGTTIDDTVSTRAPGFTPQFRVVTNIATTINATAACNATEFVITGGGGCTVPNSNTVQGRIAASGPITNGWQVTCSGGTATAVAVCSK